jgi:hypothetical protein
VAFERWQKGRVTRREDEKNTTKFPILCVTLAEPSSLHVERIPTKKKKCFYYLINVFPFSLSLSRCRYVAWMVMSDACADETRTTWCVCVWITFYCYSFWAQAFSMVLVCLTLLRSFLRSFMPSTFIGRSLSLALYDFSLSFLFKLHFFHLCPSILSISLTLSLSGSGTELLCVRPKIRFHVVLCSPRMEKERDAMKRKRKKGILKDSQRDDETQQSR